MDPPFSDGAARAGYTTPFSRAGAADGFAETDALLGPRLAAPDAGSLSPALWHLLPDDDDGGSDDGGDWCLAIKTEPPTLQLQHPPPGWPSPPLAPGDMDQCPCLLDAPPSAGALLSGYYNYTCSPASPGGCWSPPPPPPAAPAAPAALQPDDLGGLCTPPLYSLSPLPADALPADALAPAELLLRTPCSSAVTPKAESPPGRPGDVPGLAPGAGRLDEPYAKLIYHALMSRPDHAMTLQDLYQWFRDNTNKAVTEKGGWQNSIRHNLSMNAAFTKRPRRDAGCVADDPKRASQWVLEHWAVGYGVQSTTRYRKGSSRRRPAARLGALPAQHSAKRAVSGRKGGCAARDSRLRGRGCAVPRSAGPELGFGALPHGLADPLPPPPPAPYFAFRPFGPGDVPLAFFADPHFGPPMPDGLYDWGDAGL